MVGIYVSGDSVGKDGVDALGYVWAAGGMPAALAQGRCALSSLARAVNTHMLTWA